jgi:hypothetical protein
VEGNPMHKTLSTMFVFLCTFQTHLFAQKTQLEKNIDHRMEQLHLEDTISIFAVEKHKVYAIPRLTDDQNPLWQSMHNDKTVWIKNPSLFSFISHGEGEGWRTIGHASLHFTEHPIGKTFGYYEIDMDRWAPRHIKNPINSVRHLVVEVWIPKFFKRNEDHFQTQIEKTLNGFDAKLQKTEEVP